ncbi:hypothetical protein PybrP1_005137 [[Pythium] brassicae (nom. inval.)]|nr:hypothetical protein PybrP1_005137 [[Pythium] brassicae (nom. inval.)]
MAEKVTFPEGFVWGTATASYQIEGATEEGGRGDSIWDAFSRTPGKVLNGHTGAVAVDHYHRYKEDVQLMKNMGLKSYRLSISWPRIIPAGVGAVNEEGVAFYNNLINELLANGIEPLVTLYHWDLPLPLLTEFDGWLGGKHIQDAFAAYARVCFARFGDRVKSWLTLNEPWCSAFLGYGIGPSADFAAGRAAPNDAATGNYGADEGVQLSDDPTWKKTDMGWNAVPWGFQKLLLWVQKRYNPPNGIYVTENGCAVADKTKEDAQHDDFRVDFYKGYIAAMREAIAQGADVRGYFAWSFCDNYEWAEGYNKRFGIHWVDYETQERVPKKSAIWFGGVIRDNGFTM